MAPRCCPLRLRLEQSPAGTQVAVPAPFIPYHAIADPEGQPPAAYSNVMRTWVDSKLAVTEWLQFALPREVLPIQLSRAKLTLTLRALRGRWRSSHLPAVSRSWC